MSIPLNSSAYTVSLSIIACDSSIAEASPLAFQAARFAVIAIIMIQRILPFYPWMVTAPLSGASGFQSVAILQWAPDRSCCGISRNFDASNFLTVVNL